MLSVMNMMNGGAHPAAGIKPESPTSNTTTPNANSSMMPMSNPQSMPQAQFAAFASSFDPSKVYGKTNSNTAPAFWNTAPFGMPINMNNEGK
jgi:hypothetical protein